MKTRLKAIEALNESELENNKIVVRESVPGPPKPKTKRPFDPNRRTEKQ